MLGLRPTTGLVPLTGHFPRITALVDPRTVIGPLARTVADLELALALMAGPDGVDASVVPVPLRTSASVELDSLRIAVFDRFGMHEPEPVTTALLEAVSDRLRQRVSKLVRARPARIDEAWGITEAYWARPASTSLSEWAPFGEFVLSAEATERSLFQWDRLRRAMTAFFRDFDVIVCPAAARPAPELTELEDYAYLVPFSLTGNPAVAIPAGCDARGLPIGMQIVARRFEDHVALAVALAGQSPAPRPELAV